MDCQRLCAVRPASCRRSPCAAITSRQLVPIDPVDPRTAIRFREDRSAFGKTGTHSEPRQNPGKSPQLVSAISIARSLAQSGILGCLPGSSKRVRLRSKSDRRNFCGGLSTREAVSQLNGSTTSICRTGFPTADDDSREVKVSRHLVCVTIEFGDSSHDHQVFDELFDTERRQF